MAPNHYLYVLGCADGSLYCGYTTNVARRLHQHQTGRGAKYTRVAHRHPLFLLYSERYLDKHSAMAAEAAFKRLSRRQKEAYLAKRGVRWLHADPHDIMG